MLTYFYLFTNYPLLVTLDKFKYGIFIVFILEILITLAVLPFILRLSGQLLVQTLKYRQTIKNALDPEEHIPYYEHYRIMFCLLFVMILFNVFNLIKAFYLIKPLFVYYVEPISLYIVLNFWFSFQDAIISFGLLCMLQVIHFFKEKQFNFKKYFLLAILRVLWVFFIESGLSISLIYFEYSKYAGSEIVGGTSVFLFELMYLLRVMLIFRFAKEGNDTVKRMINDILCNHDLRNAMGHERVESIYRATVLFKCLSWGNFVLAALVLIPSTIEVVYVIVEQILPLFYRDYLIKNFFPYFKINSEYFLSSIFIMELVYFLTSILYTMFFLILWKFLFNKSRNVRFSGYSHFSEEFNREDYTERTTPLLAPPTFKGTKMHKFLLSYYSIVSAFITILIVGFITTLGVTGWSSVLFVHSGEFYEMNKTNLYKEMETCSRVTIERNNPLNSNQNCDQTYFASITNSTSTIPSLQNLTYNAYPSNYTSFLYTTLWVPSNTTITGLKGVSSLKVNSLMQTDVPCLDYNEEYSALQSGSLYFDCVLPETNNGKLIKNCSTTEQCQLFNVSIPVSSMINLEGIASSPAIVGIKTQIYNLSSLPVTPVSKKKIELDWRKYDLIQNNRAKLSDFYESVSCSIKFSCTLPIYYGLTISILTLILTPTYLMVSVVLIHRYNITEFCYFKKKK